MSPTAAGEARSPRRAPGRPGGRWRRVVSREAGIEEILPLLGLAGFGYALPLIDLLGGNPEFLVAHSLTGSSLLLAAVVIATIPPLLAVASVLAASAVSPRAGRIIWWGWMLVFATLAAGSLLRSLDLPSDWLQVLLAAIGGVAILLAVRRWHHVRLALGFLAVTPLIAVVALAVWSPASALVWDTDPGALEDVTVANPAPVVMLQLDELPTASLLREDGTLNADRFPNFARLAGQSTWFANTVAIAPSTTASVPAAVTGTVPVQGELPTAADHPENLFTLLGESHRLQVDEPVTAMCPQSMCGGSVDWRGLANDAIGVAGQLWLPPGLRSRLPSEVQAAADFENVDALGGDSALERQERALDGIDAIEGGADRPLLWYQHVVLPHVPWTLSHTGAEYRTSPAFANGPTDEGDWDDDPVLARLGLQRHLLQVGAADVMLGRLIDRLEAQGLWDEALVVVVADHGAAFDPTAHYRQPVTATAHEIYRVPLFVKVPGQTQGDVREDLTYNVDILPTVMEVLGIEPGWEMNGRSILEPVADRGPDAALYTADAEGPGQGGAIHPDITIDQLTAIAARNAGLLPRGGGWHGVVAAGPLGDHVGASIDDLAVSGTTAETWTLEQRADLAAVDTATTGAIPAFVWAAGPTPDGPSEVLLVLNGTVAGTLSRLGSGTTWAGVLDEDLIAQGANDVVLLVPTDVDATTFATASLANP